MKTISKLMLVVCFLSVVDANAELKQLLYSWNNNAIGGGRQIRIESGETAKLIGWWSTSDEKIQVSAMYVKDGKTILIPMQASKDSKEMSYPTIVGPADIHMFSSYERGYAPSILLHYDLQKTSTTSSGGSTSNLPSNTVVIPTDASGPVEIIMESSKDLVNWTRAEPGTYGADTPKRFFRVRAVVKP